MEIQLFNLETSKSVQENYIEKMYDLMSSNDWVLGSEVKNFEKSFSKFIGTKHCLGVNSGTDALEISLKALDVKPNDEVIVPGFSFFATSEVVLKIGAKPIYCDINKEDLTIDISSLSELINSKTKVVIPVHLFGNAADMLSINKLKQNNNFFVIEDVAQAFGSSINTEYLGSLGDLGCFSFYPTKSLGGFGDGGAITINDKALYEKILLLRNHGQKKKYFHELVGYNSRLDSLQASILELKLKNHKTLLSHNLSVIKNYKDIFLSSPIVNVLIKDLQPSNLLPISLREDVSVNKIKSLLKKNKIGYGDYYPLGLHEFNFSKHNVARKLPNVEWAKNHVITLPVHKKIGDAELNFIHDVIHSI